MPFMETGFVPQSDGQGRVHVPRVFFTPYKSWTLGFRLLDLARDLWEDVREDPICSRNVLQRKARRRKKEEEQEGDNASNRLGRQQ